MEVDVFKKVPVSEQDPQVRATNFEEVNLGYTKEEAMKREYQIKKLTRQEKILLIVDGCNKLSD